MRRALLLGLVALRARSRRRRNTSRTSFPVRRWIGHVVRRGDLQALVGRRGIYDNDVERAWRGRPFRPRRGTIARSNRRFAAEQKRAALQRLIEEARLNARPLPANRSIRPRSRAKPICCAINFAMKKPGRKSLAGADLTRARAAPRGGDQPARSQLARKTDRAGRFSLTNPRCERYYDEHRAAFQEPLRLRASHLFLAAPEGYPDDVIERQRALIEQLAKRIANGESFPALIAQFSEDEATKKRDGDLGYFAADAHAAGGLRRGRTTAARSDQRARSAAGSASTFFA